eukprot:2217743-Rhodomonas_salina.4
MTSGVLFAYAVSGTDIAHDGIRLRACYAMSGTGIAHGGIRLHACYVMSGTDIGVSRTRAMSGTEMAYDFRTGTETMTTQVSCTAIVHAVYELCHVRYCDIVSCYVVCDVRYSGSLCCYLLCDAQY